MITYPPGAGGWTFWDFGRDENGGNLLARVRFVLQEDGRLEPVEMHVDGLSRLSGDILRRIPLGSMEAYANGTGRDELLAAIEKTGPKAERATERWRTTVDAGERAPKGLDPESVRKAFRRSLRLRIPREPKYPDAFYERVAELYTALSERGFRGPAQQIADANGIEVTTVHRWIREARGRKLLPPGRRGRAG